ncbi:ABC transporter permease [Viridibacillus arvi]|uniref:ABC transporter permease n=1 Tax=Viridibacillus arvi TaxID=263475 RepID=UPI0034CFB15D
MYMIISFFKQSILSYKSLFGYLDPKLFVLVKVINPILQLIFFTMLAKFVYNTDDVTPWLIGNAFLLSIFNVVFGVGAVIITERAFGTLKLVIASTANKFLVFVGRAFIHVIDSVVTVAIGLFVGHILFRVDFSNTNFLLLILCALVSMYAAMGLGLLVGSFGLLVKDVNLILNLVMFSLLIFTGAQYAIEALPQVLQWIPDILPITRGIEASRLIVAGDISSHVYSLLGMEFFVGTIYILLGYFTLKTLENIAKKKASLDAF